MNQRPRMSDISIHADPESHYGILFHTKPEAKVKHSCKKIFKLILMIIVKDIFTTALDPQSAYGTE